MSLVPEASFDLNNNASVDASDVQQAGADGKTAIEPGKLS
jgi:hypothetical protein